MPRLSHYFNYTVERYGMMAIREGSVEVCIQSSGGSKGISLDARNLNQSANRVAGHSEMMLQSHFGSIFYLSRTASESWQAAAEAMAQATPTSPWQPTSAPLIEAFCFTMLPTNPAVAKALKMRCSLIS